MACISPFVFIGFGQMTVVTTTAAPALGMLTAGVVKDFFMNLFLNPGGNFTAVAILAGSVIALSVGAIFLIKIVYEKYCPDRP